MNGPAGDLAEAIRIAVEDTLAKHGGGMVRAYAMALDFYDAEGEPAWATAYADNQGPAATLGILRWHTLAVESDISAYFRGES